MVASAVMTHCDVLGVAPTATTEQLRHAYRCAVKTAHPDAGGSPEAFARVQQAWDQLRDPQRRATYDAGRGDVADRMEPAQHRTRTDADAGRQAAPRQTAPHRAASPRTDRRDRGLIALLVSAAMLGGSVTTWGLAQLGEVGVLATGVFLTASLGSLATRAIGLDAGRGTYRLTQRAAWTLAGALGALAGAFWILERSDVAVPAVGAACVALYAGSVGLLWRVLLSRPSR